jgi:hypothetical protein
MGLEHCCSKTAAVPKHRVGLSPDLDWLSQPVLVLWCYGNLQGSLPWLSLCRGRYRKIITTTLKHLIEDANQVLDWLSYA